jgi:hypothetical protein
VPPRPRVSGGVELERVEPEEKDGDGTAGKKVGHVIPLSSYSKRGHSSYKKYYIFCYDLFYH